MRGLVAEALTTGKNDARPDTGSDAHRSRRTATRSSLFPTSPFASARPLSPSSRRSAHLRFLAMSNPYNVPAAPEQDQMGAGDALPTYDDLAAQHGPNSR